MNNKTNFLRLIIAAFIALMLLGCNSETNNIGVTPEPTMVNAKELLQIQITTSRIVTMGTSELSLAIGITQQYTAIGIYNDGSRVDITDKVTWSGSNSNIRLSDNGLVTAIKVGDAEVVATLDNVASNAVGINVTSAVLEDIQVFFADITSLGGPHIGLAKGNTQQLRAIGMYTDGTSVDITSQVDWHSTNSNAVVSVSGEVTGVEPGFVSFTANLDGIVSNKVKFTVSAAELVSIQLMPETPMGRGSSVLHLAKGNTIQLVAMGTFTDGSTVDISNSVSWRNIDFFTEVDSNGCVRPVNEGLGHINAVKGDVTSNTLEIMVTSAILTDIQVSPASTRISIGNTQELVATGRYSDGTTVDITDSVDWKSSNIDSARVNERGVVAGVDTGTVDVVAIRGGVTSNTASISVAATSLASIQITSSLTSIAKGNSQQITALGIYSDGSTADISSSVSWMSDNTDGVTVDALGLVIGSDTGIARIVARKDGISSNSISFTVTDAVLTEIQITPLISSIAKGNSQQFMALGVYSDDTMVDISSSVNWQSGNTDSVIVRTGGLVNGVDVGTTTITARKYGVVSNTVNISVTAAILDEIVVTPSTASINKGGSQQLVATGVYTDSTSADISSSVSWLSDNTDSVTVEADGVATGVEAGNAIISASKDSVESNSVNMAVTAAVLTKITVTPSLAAVAKGNTLQLMALGLYDDGTEVDITSSVGWQSDNTNEVTVDTHGAAKGISLGGASIIAVKDGISSRSMNIVVLNAVLTEIKITPTMSSVAKGDSVQFSVTGINSDGTTVDLSGLNWHKGLSWYSDNADSVTIEANGVATGVEVGEANIRASKDGIRSNTVNIEVTSSLPSISMCGGAPDNTNERNAAGACLKVISDNLGNWFTSSPSLAVMQARQYSMAPGDNGGRKTYSAIKIEDGSSGPEGVTFARFDQLGGTEDGVGGQYDRWCQELSSMRFGGKSNWKRVADAGDLLRLFIQKNGSLWDGTKGDYTRFDGHIGYGWPVGLKYWTGELSEYGQFAHVSLQRGTYGVLFPEAAYYATCVSAP